MKKLVFVIESLQLGGAEKCLVTLLNHLDYTRFEVDLILFCKTGIFMDQVPEDVNVIILKHKKLNFLERLLYFYRRKTNFKQRHHAQILWDITSDHFDVVEEKYDVVVAYNQGFATYFCSKYLTGTKKIAWLNTNYKEAGYDINFDFPIYTLFDTVVAVSNEVAAIFKNVLALHNYDLPITIILDIVDDQEIKLKAKEPIEVHFDKNNFNIVSVGRLAKPKAFDLAIMACKLLIDKGYMIKWYLIGEGNERSYLEDLIKRHNLQNHFFLCGASVNPYPYITNALIFVQTSLFEGLGTTIIEASILGKPIVSTNFPSIYSMIQDEQTGLIAEMNAESITEKIERLLVDENLRQKFSMNLFRIESKEKEKSLQKINYLFNT